MVIKEQLFSKSRLCDFFERIKEKKEEHDKQDQLSQQSLCKQTAFCRNRVKYCGQKKPIKVMALRLITTSLNYLF